MKITLLEINSSPTWSYKFQFALTRYVFGFGFTTPNFATGYYLNPLTALKSFMEFTSKRDMKITKIGG